jgi:hypothetical protein
MACYCSVAEILLYQSMYYRAEQQMSELREIRSVFQGLETLYQTYLPKVDPTLIHDLLIREHEKSERAPFYMVEIFTNSNVNSEDMKEHIYQTTGMLPAIYDNGTHYVTNQRLTLEILKEICSSEDVLEVTGDYTGTLTGRGASHEPREHKH